MNKLLVCGTRVGSKREYSVIVNNALTACYYQDKDKLCIIHGNCPESADMYADAWAIKHDINII